MENHRWISLYRRFAIALYGLGIAVCAVGFLRFESNMEDVFQWLPDQTAQREVYDQFVDRFGTDDFLVVTWPQCTLDDPRCDDVADALTQQDQLGLIASAVSGRQLVRDLQKQSRLSKQNVIDRFRGIYFGPNGRSTCIVVLLTEQGMDNRRTCVSYVKQVASKSLGTDQSNLILAGYPQVGAYGDKVVRESIAKFVGPSCLISTLVAWACLRHFGLTVVILAISGLASGLSVAAVTLSGSKWGGLSSVIPTLAYILSVSGSLHLVNYARSPDPQRIFIQALRIGWKPCLFSSLTTAAGMLSLCRSDFPAIREFGVYCACGVFASLVCQLLFVPCAIDWLAPDRNQSHDQSSDSPFLDRLLPWSRWVVFAFVLATVIAGVGLLRLRSDLEVERNFSSTSEVIQNIKQLEQSIGPVEQTELLVTFTNVTSKDFSKRLSAIRQLQGQLVDSPQVKNVLSVAAWIPDEPTGGTLRSTAARAVYRRMIDRSRTDLAASPYLHCSEDAEVWRISIRVPFLAATDFQSLDQAIPELALNQLSQSLPMSQVSVEHTGVSLLYHVAQDELIADLYRNFATAFVLICPLMVLVLQSIRQGFIAMIPNLCPAVLGYGLLGWLDYPIDIGMAMTACVGLGIAVDDTTHFMLRIKDLAGSILWNPSASQREPNALRQEVSPTRLSTRAALNIAFHQCSRAMFHTTLITTLGLTAFLFGPLATMTRFACLLMGLISIALLCDLVLLPCLLNTFRIKRKES